ncbi:MAG: cytochrome c oxidase subunit II [Chloroflexota bacterium]|nr:MAG: cytochrome c oxidase subunit II [Chloroflexota bacterium]
MSGISSAEPRRVLIVSSHPLFGEGLRRLLQERRENDVEVVGIVSSVEQAISAFDSANPDLVIVDYDDERVNRDEFLARFVEGARRMRVVLLSLKEGGSEALVYDRRSTAASQIDDWLREGPLPRGEDRPGGKSRLMKRPIFLPKSRISSNPLRSGEKETDARGANMKHFILAAILIAIIAAGTVFGLSRVNLLPVAASLQAGPIDQLFNVHFTLIGLLFALIVGLMLYSILAFRRKAGDDTDAEHIEGNTRLEVIWTIIPLAVVIYISYLGAVTLSRISRPDPDALKVRVIGSQWSWRFEYPEQGITSTDLVLPVNKQVLLELTSTDVIHSFWVPEFRVKQDMLPGGEEMVRELRVTPSLIGEYKVRCAEMCGRLHSNMEAPVRVVAQGDFDAWVTAQGAAVSDNPAERGQVLAQQFGCLACHTTDGSPMVGPTWEGVFGEQVELQDGSTVTVDEVYLHESIVDPSEKIVAGFNDIMPKTFDEQMTDEQIADVIAFIKSLK